MSLTAQDVSENTGFRPILVTEEEKQRTDNEAARLIEGLEELVKKNPKRGGVREFSNSVLGSDIVVHSWRFNEWDYSSNKVVLPTYARGLFTSGNKIICRGYEKFYNLNEFQGMNEDVVAESTIGPYTVTVKSNGCIIFMSGLSDGNLVVCSKHSTGMRTDVQKNHALVAEQALERQLEQKGLSKKDLAKVLYELDCTAVAEFCDDSFEEHVLEYKGEKAGLYLHGLNTNTVQFKTYPIKDVNKFGDLFGFKPTNFIRFNTFEETANYFKSISETGSFEGEQVEGFVVRCFKKDKGQDFFFKYKFEEPYLLYRELREVTKQLIKKGTQNINFGKHKLICMDYLKFIMPILHDNKEIQDQYLNNQNVIELRKMYFKAKGRSDLETIDHELSMSSLEEEMRSLNFGTTQPNRYVLVTVSTIGCGKTTTSKILTSLFPDLIGHIQNDNIRRPVGDKLISGALEILVDKPVVIVDKNNHQFRERRWLFNEFSHLNELIPSSKLKFICLNFLQSPPKMDQRLWKLTSSRITKRGDNHQTIKASRDGSVKIKKIMGGFVSRFQMVNPHKEPDSNFNLIIDLKVDTENSSLENAKRIVSQLQSFAQDLHIKTPTDEQFNLAFQKALEYKPPETKIVSKPRICHPLYFGIRISDSKALFNQLNTLAETNPECFSSFLKLSAAGRLLSKLHVTMIHVGSRKGNNNNKKLWNKYNKKIFKTDLEKIGAKNDLKNGTSFDLPSGASADIRLEKLCSSNDLCCIKVEILKLYWHEGDPLDLKLGNAFPHITLGTRSSDIKPFKSNSLLESVYEFGETSGIETFDFKNSEENIIRQLPIAAYY
ncbi:hypothetical protein HII12_003194 [Brettanomyces bruxellensis]|uniref:tRNA ligase n=1 Tax=Dekkera bruxellensis TaxID=5007 RepID=A0A8H6BD61_DEKBR|nr:hypothetical protein HII12_003194 [Brettanomyces bruxellensis]